jgi:hypothetical protein
MIIIDDDDGLDRCGALRLCGKVFYDMDHASLFELRPDKFARIRLRFQLTSSLEFRRTRRPDKFTRLI